MFKQRLIAGLILMAFICTFEVGAATSSATGAGASILPTVSVTPIPIITKVPIPIMPPIVITPTKVPIPTKPPITITPTKPPEPTKPPITPTKMPTPTPTPTLAHVPPIIVLPINGSELPYEPVKVSWETKDLAKYYMVVVKNWSGPQASSAGLVVYKYQTTATNCVIPNTILTVSNKYSVEVGSVFNDGYILTGTGNVNSSIYPPVIAVYWSKPVFFTLKNSVLPPIIQKPTDGAILPYADVPITWSSSSAALYYSLVLVTNSTLPVKEIKVYGTAYTVTKAQLFPGLKHTILLKAVFSNGTSLAAKPVSFTINKLPILALN